MKKIEEYVRSIPDFPEEGIIFRDVTSVLQDADGLRLSIDLMQKELEGVEFDVIVGPESRGFIFGVPIAYNLHKAFVPVRKKGKLPCETVQMEYDLEYGSAVIEMHKDSIKPGQKVVIIDDVITAGTSMRESLPLLEAAAKGVEVVGVIISVDRTERGKGDKSAIQEMKEEFGIPVYPIVTAREIIDALYNVEVDGKVYIDDAMKAKMEAYLEQYGVKDE